jgi:cellulose synthase operon protein C
MPDGAGINFGAMIEMALLLPLLLAPPHGGQYIPPAPDPATPTAVEGIVAQPGLGPQLVFDAARWEWWFDFNQEPLLDLRTRLPGRAASAGARFEPVTADDRGSVVLPLLLESLRDQPATGLVQARTVTRDVRAAAVLSLGRLQRAEAVPYIELVLEGDPDLFVRTQAVLALGFSGSPQAVETLVRLFRDEKQGEEIRTYAVVSLALIGNAQALDVLRAALAEKALADLNNQLRGAVIYAAGVSGDAALGDALRALPGTYFFGKEPDVRALLAGALGRLGEAASVAPLLELLGDSDNQVRRSAAAGFEALTGVLAPEDVEKLIAHAGEENDAPTRRVLLRALGAARAPAAREYLQAQLTEGSFDDQPHVALGLALDAHFSNGPVLLASLEKAREASHIGALALALGLLDAPDAIAPVTARLLEAKDPLLQPNLALAVGLLDPDQSELAAHLETLARTSADVEVVRSSVIALGLLGERERLAAVAAAIPQVGGLVRRAAMAHALGLVGDRNLITPLAALARDDGQQPYVRAYALQALGELCDPREISPCWRLSAHAEMHLEVGFVFELYRVL